MPLLPPPPQVFTVMGRRTVSSGDATRKEVTELGWAALQLFDFRLKLAQGTFLLTLWPPGVEKQARAGPGG